MANGKTHPQFDRPDATPVAGPAALAVRAALTRSVERLLLCDPAARQGLTEGVHGMRTSTRRLRSALRTFGELVRAEWALPIEEELKWLAQMLGAVRDLDVLRDRLLRDAGRSKAILAPLFRALAEEHERASAVLKDVLQGDRYRVLIDRLEQAVLVTPVRLDVGSRRRSELPRLAAKSWKSLMKRARALRPNDPDKDFHDVRKRAKRARYAAEDLAEVIGKRRAKEAIRFAQGLTKVQDVLGEHQDAVTAAQTISRIVATQPTDVPFKLTAHRLLKLQLRLADDARERYFKVWDKLDRKKRRRWLKP